MGVKEDVIGMRQELKDFIEEFRRLEELRAVRCADHAARVSALEHWRTATAASVVLLAAWARDKFGFKL